MKTKTLDSHISLTGMTLDLVERNGNIAIYEKKRSDDGRHVSYEVIKIRIAKVGKMFKNLPSFKEYDFYERYPSSSDFGSYGWDFGGKNDVKYARDKFDKLVREQNML